MYYALDTDLLVIGFEVKSDRDEFVFSNDLRRKLTRDQARRHANATSNGKIYDVDLNVIKTVRGFM